MSSLRLEEFEEAFEALLEAVVLRELMPSALEKLAHAAGAGAITMHEIGPHGVRTNQTPNMAEFMDVFHKEGWATNPRMTRGMALTRQGFQGFMTERDVLSEDELKRDPFEHEFQRPRGYSSYAAMVIGKRQGAILPLVFNRKLSEGSYSREDIRLLNTLAPQLGAFARMAMRMSQVNNLSTLRAMQMRGIAAALISGDGEVIERNEAFDNLPGKQIQISGNRLILCDPHCHEELRLELHGLKSRFLTRQGRFKPIIIRRKDGELPIVLELCALEGAATDIFNNARAIVFADDLAKTPSFNDFAIANVFGLSKKEAELALGIAQGRSLNALAQESGASYETLRSRLKDVFNKTNTTRQAELAALIGRFKI